MTQELFDPFFLSLSLFFTSLIGFQSSFHGIDSGFLDRNSEVNLNIISRVRVNDVSFIFVCYLYLSYFLRDSFLSNVHRRYLSLLCNEMV